MKPLVAFCVLLVVFAAVTVNCQQSVRNGTEPTPQAELASDSSGVSRRASDYSYDEEFEVYDDDDDEVYDGESEEEKEAFRRSAAVDYNDYEEDDDDENEDNNDESDSEDEDEEEEEEEEWDLTRFRRTSHFSDSDDEKNEEFDFEDDSDEDTEVEEEEEEEEEEKEEKDDDDDDGYEDNDEVEEGLVDNEYGLAKRSSSEEYEFDFQADEDKDEVDDDEDYDVENEEREEGQEEEGQEERFMFSRSLRDPYDGEESEVDYDQDDYEEDADDDEDDDEEEEDDDDNDRDRRSAEESAWIYKRPSYLSPTQRLRNTITTLDGKIHLIRSKEYYKTLDCWQEKANQMEQVRDQLQVRLDKRRRKIATFFGQYSRPKRNDPDKSPQEMSRSELQSEIKNLKRRIWHIRQSPHYEMSHYKCWRDLADNMELYVDKLKKELSTKKAGKESDGWGSFEKIVGKDRRVRHKFTPERKERDAPTEAEQDSRDKRDCDDDEDGTLSISQLAAETVKIEKEIQKKIAQKLEQRLQQTTSQKAEEGVLQKEVESAVESDIENKVQKKLKQQAGDLPGKVRELERNYQQLKKELENSPWSRFQQVMMEHVRENGELGETLTEEEFQRLQQMHTMSAAERKAFVKALRKKVKLTDDDDDEVEKKKIPKPEKPVSGNKNLSGKKAHSKTEVGRKGPKEEVSSKSQPRKEKKTQLKKKKQKKGKKGKKPSSKKENELKKVKKVKVVKLPKKGKGQKELRKRPQEKEPLKPTKVKSGLEAQTRKLQKGKKGPNDRKELKKRPHGLKKKPKQQKKGKKMRPKGLKKKGKKGKRKGKKGQRRGRKGRKGRKGKKGKRRRKKGRGRKNKANKKGRRRNGKHNKKGGKKLKREKRGFESRGEWSGEDVPAISQNNDPIHGQKKGAVSIKYQLPPKTGLWRSAVVRGPLSQSPHPLEWAGDYQQQSSQPGLRNRRSSKKREREKTGDETVKETDQCGKCEAKVGEEVCGSNGKTYNSLCHAVHCGGLREMDVTFGSCGKRDPCNHNHCSSSEICAAMTYGPCLTVYANNGRRLPCRQYICVAKEDCGHMEYSEVCGVDENTYPTLCHLQQREVKLAYSGHCREGICRGSVCGRNGVTYPSSCHARAHNVRVDYRGTCFAENLEDHVRSCADVRQTGMCAPANCPDALVPEGACCPVCGGGVEVKPEAARLAELARDWPEINHLYMIENFLRQLVPQEMETQCDLSLTLTDSGAIMMVLEAEESRHSAACQAAAMDVAEKINRPSPGDDTLRPLARKARLLGGLGGNVVQQSLQNQASVVTSDVSQAKASTTNKMVGSYNSRVESMESYANEGGSSGSVCLLASLFTAAAALAASHLLTH